MSAESLPETVQRLLRDRLKSFEQLEVLLLLHRRADQHWTAAAASLEVRLAEDLVADALAALQKHGLIRSAGLEFRYDPAESRVAAAVEDLVIACRNRHAAVMSQMSTNAIERIRSGSLRAFADSFVLGRKKDLFFLADLHVFPRIDLFLLRTVSLMIIAVLLFGLSSSGCSPALP
jgi:hypothetical protein